MAGLRLDFIKRGRKRYLVFYLQRIESITLNSTDSKITSLKLQKRNQQRVNVYLNGEFAFGLSRILASKLYIGQEISAEMVSQLQAEDTYEVGFQIATKFISYQPRTEAEVRRKLEEKNIGQETIHQIIERLKGICLLDDTKYAQSWVDSRNEHRPRSRRALAYELRHRGIDPKIIDQATETFDDDEMAYRAALKQSRKLEKIEMEVFCQKMLRHLSQRGFSYEVSKQAISRVLKEKYDTNQLEKNEALL